MVACATLVPAATAVLNYRRQANAHLGGEDHKAPTSGTQFAMSVGFGTWFLVQGLHDLSVDLWACSTGTRYELRNAIAAAALDQETQRLAWWQGFYQWKKHDPVLKGLEAPFRFMPVWLGVFVVVIYAIMGFKFLSEEFIAVKQCFQARKPGRRHLSDMAYSGLLWLVLVPVIVLDITPLESRVETCSIQRGNSEAVLDPGNPVDLMVPCAELAVDLLCVHAIKTTVQIGMLAATCMKFFSGSFADQEQPHLKEQ